jgi:undecaprenyl diphosphate synthase
LLRDNKKEKEKSTYMNILQKFIGIGAKENKDDIDLNNVPEHIAIIMDGNGRWAKKRGVPRNVGHREGANNLKRTVSYCIKLGVKYLTVYAFSTENWKRPKEEIDALMNLLKEFLSKSVKEMSKENVRINILGDITALPSDIQNEIIMVEKSTRNNKKLVLNIALNYGSRTEIVNAVKIICNKVKKSEINEDEISEEIISKFLYTKSIPDPDLVIRTSGEYRISNFLLWQTAYSEFWFDKALWPDFSEKHLLKAISSFQNRQRRYGGI